MGSISVRDIACLTLRPMEQVQHVQSVWVLVCVLADDLKKMSADDVSVSHVQHIHLVIL